MSPSCGLLPLLVVYLRDSEGEHRSRVGYRGLVTWTVFTMLALLTVWQLVHNLGVRWVKAQVWSGR